MPNAARPKPTLSPWTPPEILLRSLQAIRREPIALALSLGIAPTLWSLPADWLRDRLIGAESSPATSMSVLVSVASYAWGTIPFGGELLIGIDAARGRRVSWTRFREGLRFAPRLLVTVLIVFLPIELVFGVFPQDAGGGVPLARLAGSVIVAILVARTILWAPYIVDARTALFESLVSSWIVTSGYVLRLIVLAVALTLPVILVALLEFEALKHSYAASALGSIGYSLAVGHLYVLAPRLGRPGQSKGVAH
jgi:hypothetical protein